MRDIIKMIIVLTVIATVLGTALSLVEGLTREKIEYSKIKFVKGPAVLSILTDYDNDPIKEVVKNVMLKEKLGLEVATSIFPAKKDDKRFAVAFEIMGKGYGGTLGVMIGIDLDTGNLTGMRVTTHLETPGLGSRAKTDPEFYEQFSNLGIEDIGLSDKGGAIDAISGATNTSKGVVKAVKKGLELFALNKDKITSTFGNM